MWPGSFVLVHQPNEASSTKEWRCKKKVRKNRKTTLRVYGDIKFIINEMDDVDSVEIDLLKTFCAPSQHTTHIGNNRTYS